MLVVETDAHYNPFSLIQLCTQRIIIIVALPCIRLMSDIICYQFYKKSGSGCSATKAGWKSKPFRPYFSNSSQSWYYLVQIVSSRYITNASYVFYRLCRKIVTYMLHYLCLLQLYSTYCITSVSYNCQLHTVSSLYPTFIFYLCYHLSDFSSTSLCILKYQWCLHKATVLFDITEDAI
jgi:hypothetical protein